MRPPTSLPFLLRASCLASALVWMACEAGGGGSPLSVETRFAKGGTAGGRSEITVKRADPDTALQGESLQVRVLGSGFDETSSVSFEIDGKPVNDITVQGTSFVDSTEVVADISVAADARVTRYDIAVQSGKGKKGVGLELFAVKYNGPPDQEPLSVTVADGYDVASDGGGSYVDGTQNVQALIVGSDNFQLDVKGSGHNGHSRKTNPDDRKVLLTLRDPSTGAVLHTASIDANVTTSQPDLEGAFRALAVGETMTTRMRFLWQASDGSGQWLRYGSRCEYTDGTGWTDDPGSRVTVTAVPGGWTIEGSVAYWCLGGDPLNVVPHPDAGPDGLVQATLRFEAYELFP